MNDDIAPGGQATVNSLPAAALLACTGGCLDGFLYLNHGQVFAGVMTGNAILGGINVFHPGAHGALHYALPIAAYVFGILCMAVAQQKIRHDLGRIALGFVMLGFAVLSFAPNGFSEKLFVFFTVFLTGALVGISQNVQSFAYNATVLTGSLRDGTISLFKAHYRPGDTADERKARDLWLIMASLVLGAVASGVCGRHFGNRTLWLPVALLGAVLCLVVRKGSHSAGLDLGHRRTQTPE